MAAVPDEPPVTVMPVPDEPPDPPVDPPVLEPPVLGAVPPVPPPFGEESPCGSSDALEPQAAPSALAAATRKKGAVRLRARSMT